MSGVPDILVGCYHKTGTFVLGRLARRLAKELGGTFVNVSGLSQQQTGSVTAEDVAAVEAALAGPDRKIIFDWASRFALIDDQRDYIGFRVVRDPRDITISSANYHGWSDERWLHVPNPEFGGLTYHQRMKELDLAEAIHFEIEHRAGRVINDMLCFERSSAVETASYETLIAQRDVSAIKRIAHHLRIAEPMFERIYLDSTKTEVARDRTRTAGIRSHIQDGSVRQWIYLLGPEHLDHLNDTLPGCAERLGYEPSVESALRPDRAKRLRYSSLFWANRGNIDRAIDEATELARTSDDDDSKLWLAALLRSRQNIV